MADKHIKIPCLLLAKHINYCCVYSSWFHVFSLPAIRELHGLTWCVFAFLIIVRERVAERQLQTSAAFHTHGCHMGASSEFPGEVKLLQWTTAKGNLTHQFDFTMRWGVFTGHSEVSSGKKKVQQRKLLTNLQADWCSVSFQTPVTWEDPTFPLLCLPWILLQSMTW